MKTKIIILSICAAIVLTAVGSGVWLMGSSKKAKAADFAGKTDEQIRAYLRSDEFRKLDEQTRRATARAAFRQVNEYQVNTYFALPADDQTAYLDKLIDDMQARRRQRQLGANDPNSPFRIFDPNGRSNDPNTRQRRMAQRLARGPEMQRARREAIDPLTRAKMAAFRDALRARMDQRGISPGGGGGGFGGGR